MQNYEILVENLKEKNKALKDSASALVRLQKSIAKNTDIGNLVEARKSLAAIYDTVAQVTEQAQALQEELDGFDVQEYFISGDFTEQLLEACAAHNIDVKGEKGVYEMFPNKVRVLGDAEHAAEIWLDRKKMQSVRPTYVAETIATGQAKLKKANFNETSFMNELGEAYEITCLRAGARVGSTQSLNKIYKNLALMARSRKEYDLQAFAFDLARLFDKGPGAWVNKAGTHFDFGTSRDGNTGIRVLSSTGAEYYISTLKAKNVVE